MSRLVKSKKLWWAGHVTEMRGTRNRCRILVGTPLR